jgi:hypothetical protein
MLDWMANTIIAIVFLGASAVGAEGFTLFCTHSDDVRIAVHRPDHLHCCVAATAVDVAPYAKRRIDR